MHQGQTRLTDTADRVTTLAKLNPPARRAMRSPRGCSGLHVRLLCVALTAASAQNTLKLPVEVDQSGAASSNAPRPRLGLRLQAAELARGALAACDPWGSGSETPGPAMCACVGPPSGAV